MKEDFMKKIIIERPVGSLNNEKVLNYLEKELNEMGFNINSLFFKCKLWESDKSYLSIDDKAFEVNVSPFSEGFKGRGKIEIVGSISELQNMNCKNKILILTQELAKEPLQPKDYPFYYPEEHKQLINLLEEKSPLAIIAVTGKHSMCGLDPFPLFEDGNFLIPSAYINEEVFKEVKKLYNKKICSLVINSKKILKDSRQIIATKKSKSSRGKIVICAHMDTKYNTLGCLDNAVGIASLLEIAKRVKTEDYDIEIVPFNTEEYYEGNGEVEYLKYLENNKEKPILFVNIDSPCHIGSKISVSTYNLDDKMKKINNNLISKSENVELGEEWYAGDHTAFAFRGISCIAITSSDIFSGALDNTHTMKDTMSTVDMELIKEVEIYVNNLIMLLK